MLSGQDLRAANRLARQRRRPEYNTVSQSAAALSGYRPVTASFCIRQFDQCEMLDRVITDFSGCDVLLVRNGSANRISLWRR
jgi:hypothetical protein